MFLVTQLHHQPVVGQVGHVVARLPDGHLNAGLKSTVELKPALVGGGGAGDPVVILDTSHLPVLQEPLTSSQFVFITVWSTLIGRGMSRLGSHWSKASPVMLAPAILCHKEPARRIQSPLLGALERKIPQGGYFACSSLVLYGIRELAPALLSTNERQASTFLDQ